MKILAASPTISRIIVAPTWDSRSFSSFQTDNLLNRTGVCFLRSQKCPNFGLFHLISERNEGIVPVSALSSELQAIEIQTTEAQNQEIYESKTVRVKFQLQRECMFGEQFLIVGDDPIFGVWDPSNAIPLNWSDGHLWMVELDITIGKPIQFKFILKGQNGDILWQPGPDRIFQPWETHNSIVVCEDWDNAESQKIIEEQIGNQNASSVLLAETLMDSAISADNISYSNKSSIDSGSKKSRTSDDIFRDNYEAATIKKSSSSVKERGPVLVPGLTPSQTTGKEAIPDEVAIDGSCEAHDDIAEIDLNPEQPFPSLEGRTGAYNVNTDPLYIKFKEIDDAVLKNGRQWGRKMLQAFLNNLGRLLNQI